MLFGTLFWTLVDMVTWRVSQQYLLRGLLMYSVTQRYSLLARTPKALLTWTLLAGEYFLIYGSCGAVFLNILFLVFIFQQARILLNKNSLLSPGVVGALALGIEPLLTRFILNRPFGMNHFTLGSICVNLVLLYVILGTRGNRC